MATDALKTIFLSASIPLPERHPKYHGTVDVIAIRDAVISLASTVLPKHKLVWGGHPSITPIIYYVMRGSEEALTPIRRRTKFVAALISFMNGENTFDRNSSVLLMRNRMFSEHKFAAGIFIGGMEGIEEEFRLFREFHPHALILPIASTGAATRIVYSDLMPREMRNERFEKDYAYMSLFQDFLIDRI